MGIEPEFFPLEKSFKGNTKVTFTGKGNFYRQRKNNILATFMLRLESLNGSTTIVEVSDEEFQVFDPSKEPNETVKFCYI